MHFLQCKNTYNSLICNINFGFLWQKKGHAIVACPLSFFLLLLTDLGQSAGLGVNLTVTHNLFLYNHSVVDV